MNENFIYRTRTLQIYPVTSHKEKTKSAAGIHTFNSMSVNIRCTYTAKYANLHKITLLEKYATVIFKGQSLNKIAGNKQYLHVVSVVKAHLLLLPHFPSSPLPVQLSKSCWMNEWFSGYLQHLWCSQASTPQSVQDLTQQLWTCTPLSMSWGTNIKGSNLGISWKLKDTVKKKSSAVSLTMLRRWTTSFCCF